MGKDKYSILQDLEDGAEPITLRKSGWRQAQARIYSSLPPWFWKAVPWMCLFTATLCTSTLAPAFKTMGQLGVHPLLRACWRSQVMMILLFIPAVLEYRSLKPEAKIELKQRSTFLSMLKVSSFWAGSLAFWVLSLDHTTSARASIFANTTPLILVCWYKIRKVPVSNLEVSGTGVAFGGIALTACGTLFFASSASGSHVSWIGDLLNVCAAACSACYLSYAGPARKVVPLFTFTLTATTLLSIPLTILSFTIEGTNFSTGANGIFAWAMPQFVKLVMFISVVVGVVGVNLNSYAMLYVAPLYISLVKLCDPFFSGMFSYLVHVDPFPSIWTFIGGAITVCGIGILSYGAHKRKKREALVLIVQQAGLNAVAELHSVSPQSITKEASSESTVTEPLLQTAPAVATKAEDAAKLELILENISSVADISLAIGHAASEGIQSAEEIVDNMSQRVQDVLLNEALANAEQQPYIPFTLPSGSAMALISTAQASIILVQENLFELETLSTNTEEVEAEQLNTPLSDGAQAQLDTIIEHQ